MSAEYTDELKCRSRAECRHRDVASTQVGDRVDSKDVHEVEHRGNVTPHIAVVQSHLYNRI